MVTIIPFALKHRLSLLKMSNNITRNIAQAGFAADQRLQLRPFGPWPFANRSGLLRPVLRPVADKLSLGLVQLGFSPDGFRSRSAPLHHQRPLARWMS